MSIAAIKVQVCFPVADAEGESFPLQTWTWWRDETVRLMDVLEDSQGPWTTRSERHRWLIWTVRTEEQLNVLLDFAKEARRRFGVESIYVEHHPITYSMLHETKWPDQN